MRATGEINQEQPMFELTIGSQAVHVIDLTLPVTLETAVYPGDPTIERKVFSSIDETGFEHRGGLTSITRIERPSSTAIARVKPAIAAFEIG